MRKLVPVTIGVLALAAGGAAVYLAQKPLAALTSRPRVAECLPGSTLLLLSAPDPGQTVADWKTTDLYKLWNEPEVQAFLEKPLSQVPPHPEASAALARAAKLEPKNLFIALTSLDEKSSEPHLIAGFQFKGDSKDVDALLAKPKAWLRQKEPASKADLLNYQGCAIETLEMPDGNRLASVFLDDWYLISNDLALLKATIDALEHRAPADVASLDKDAAFRAVCAKLPAGHETLLFARSQPFLSRIFSLAAAGGQPVPAASRAQAEKVQAFGATTRIEDGKLRDTSYALAPGSVPGALAMSGLPLTSANTVLYAATALKWPATLELPSLPGTPAAAALAGLEQWAAMLKSQGITLEALRAALGGEASVLMDWPANAPQPELAVNFDLRDHDGAQKLLDGLTALPLDGPAWQKEAAADEAALYTLNLPGAVFLTPALTLTDKHLILGLSPAGVRAAAARERAGAGALAQAADYKTAVAAVVKANAAFGYLDTRAFFERAYGVLKPAAVMGAALFAPQVSDYVDLSKLPASETVSRHLSPIVFSKASDADGVTAESFGSVTLGQAAIGFAAGIGAIAAPILQKQYGAPASSSPTPKSPDPAIPNH